MTSERDDLYRAVLAEPDADAPRLILADWLDEHDAPERAEFIRVQVEMARMPPHTARWRPLGEQAALLIRKFKSAWTAPVLERVLNAEFARGFVDRVRLTVDQFLASATELLRLEPIRVWEFGHVALLQRGPGLSRLVEHPAVAQIRGLSAGQFSPDDVLDALARSPHLAELRSLDLAGRYPGPESIERLFAAAPNLAEIVASSFPLQSIRSLWTRAAPARLTRLTLDDCRVTDHALEHLAWSPASANLEALYLDRNDLSARGAEAIAGSDHLGRLRELSLAEAPLGDRGVRALASSPILANLEVLNLSGCQLDQVGARAILESPHLNKLRCLCLDDNRVPVEIEDELAKRFGPKACSFSWGRP